MPVKKTAMVYGEKYISVWYMIPDSFNFAYDRDHLMVNAFSLRERKVGSIKRNRAGKVTGFTWERESGDYYNLGRSQKEQIFALQERDAAEAFLKKKQEEFDSVKRDFQRTQDLAPYALGVLDRMVSRSPVWLFMEKCGIGVRDRDGELKYLTSHGCGIEHTYGSIYCYVLPKMELEDEVYFRLVVNRPELSLYYRAKVNVFDEIPEWLRIMGEGRLSDWKTTTPAGEFYQKLKGISK